MSRQENELPRRIGIWAAYHVTLGPSEGIGVFIHNLAVGLAQLPSPPEILITTLPGDAELFAATIAAGKGQIRVRELARPSSATRLIGKLARGGMKFAQRLAAFFPWLCAPATSCAHACRRFVQRCQQIVNPQLAAEISACDLWLLPYPLLEREFSQPTVVVVHDLVAYHFPDVVSASELAYQKELIPRVTQRAKLVACMSEFIREHDLLGELQLPAEKVRVVKPAIPVDEPMSAEDRPQMLEVFQTQYLFYPASFRSYKNHALLVAAVAEARRRGLSDLQLVFTGMADPPASLTKEIAAHGLQQQVHVLKKVSRTTLTALYQQAFATIVPSLYEQGSFPILEGLRSNSPVACSDIPSLREAFAPLGKAMLYFDPRSVASLTEVILQIAREREMILKNQQAAKQMLHERTWVAAAAEWMVVFREALGSSGIKTVPDREN